jgi:LPXTG-site transpeptidase (sortase) family protein
VLSRLEIPSISLDKIVVEGVSPDDLKKGPGHFPETPLPGQFGNAALAGHRTTYGEPFFDIDLIQMGDDLVMTVPWGRFVYVVDNITIVGADDYASMREILTRRLRRGIAEDELPDLLVVDGGRGQLGVAVGVLHDLGLSLPVIGIVKPRTEHARGETDATDRLLLPHHKEPLRLPAGHPALRLIQHLRDEVHAHALRYHRKVRGEAQLASVLEGIAGVGPARRRALLTALGSAQAVADASPDALAAVPGVGPALAQAIHDALNPS